MGALYLKVAAHDLPEDVDNPPCGSSDTPRGSSEKGAIAEVINRSCPVTLWYWSPLTVLWYWYLARHDSACAAQVGDVIVAVSPYGGGTPHLTSKSGPKVCSIYSAYRTFFY